MKTKLYLSAFGHIYNQANWEEYLMTEKGLVEYFIKICMGVINIDDFDADYLGAIVCAWYKYRDFVLLSEYKIRAIEKQAKILKLL